jgi:hypothetical protein
LSRDAARSREGRRGETKSATKRGVTRPAGSARRGAWVLGVDRAVGQAVEAIAALRADHRDDDPEDGARRNLGRQQHAEQREQEREQRVLELIISSTTRSARGPLAGINESSLHCPPGLGTAPHGCESAPRSGPCAERTAARRRRQIARGGIRPLPRAHYRARREDECPRSVASSES